MRRDQASAERGRPVGQELQRRLIEAGVVGERGEIGDLGARRLQGRLEAPRLGDAGDRLYGVV